ncbi:uncharacterized protein LOC119838602 [Zerene cesonia]|uniref:uncharacterized protein LOC119838602 n=1 Tax=Zerene cesonia TaxID=33412 RepID=UPI0018E54A88|nr:uncharacterized protein LOC119838602 [Zerene cesonia]
MDKSDKIRNRKTKLIPREFVDSDDELQELQYEVEQTLARIRGDKASTSNEQTQPQFSIKVEVEECYETNDDVVELNSSDEEQLSDLEQDVHNLNLMSVLEASHKHMETSTNIADFTLHMEVVNYCKQPPVPNVKSNHELVLEKALTRWRDWFSLAADLREPPLIYKCYICNLAWWHLSEFRSHIYVHVFKTFRVSLEIINCVQCNIVAYEKMDKRFIDPGAKCWRCGEPGSEHQKPNKCGGCSKDFFSCMKLVEHQWYCDAFKAKQIKVFQKAKKMYKCHLCPRYYFQEDTLFDHMVSRHSVRTDVPVAWTLVFCQECRENVEDYSHVCAGKVPNETCVHCNRLFHSKALLALHKLVSKHPKVCRVCMKRVSKECMLAVHMMRHTDSYLLLYRCLLCPKPVYLDPTRLLTHSVETHQTSDGYSVPHEFMFIPMTFLRKHGVDAEISDLSNIKINPVITVNFVSEGARKTEAVHNMVQDDEVTPIINEAKNINSRNRIETPPNTEVIDTELKETPQETIVNVPTGVNDDVTQRVQIKEEKVDDIHEMEVDNEIGNRQECIDAVANLIENVKTELEVQFDNAEQTMCPIVTNVVSFANINENNVTDVNMVNSNADAAEETNQNDLQAQESIHSSTDLKMSIDDVTNSINIPNPVANIEIKLSYQNNDLKIKEEPLPDEIQDSNWKLSDIRKIYHIDVNLSAEPTNGINIKQEIDVNGKCENNWELLSNVFENFNEARQETDDEYENDLIIIEPKEEIVTINSEDDLSSHSDADDSDSAGKKKRRYQCRRCDFIGVHREYAAHKRDSCVSKRRSPRPEIHAANYPCSTCKVTFSSFRRYLRHFSVHKFPKHACPQCFNISSSHVKLERHVLTHVRSLFVSFRSIKVVKSTFKCKVCDLSVNRDVFFEHWERHLEIKEWGFNEVTVKREVDYDPGVRRVIEILTHPDKMAKQLSAKYRSCVVCNRRFNRRNDCMRHIIEHLLLDAFKNKSKYTVLKCQICGEGFEKPEGFRRHLRFHASLPVYKCELCNKTFSDSSNFSKHKKVHNLRIVICDICGKKFNNKLCLIKHIEGHSTAEPVQCGRCGKRFYSGSALRKHHTQMHDKLSPKFKCQQCQLRFLTLREKWDHLWHVHKERSTKADCPTCGAEFRRARDVKAHVDSVHRKMVTVKADSSKEVVKIEFDVRDVQIDE